MSSGSNTIEYHFLMRDPTLVARLLLSGAAVEIPIVSATECFRLGDGYSVTLEMDTAGVTLIQWATPDELEGVVRWMVTQAVAMQDRLDRN